MPVTVALKPSRSASSSVIWLLDWLLALALSAARLVLTFPRRLDRSLACFRRGDLIELAIEAMPGECFLDLGDAAGQLQCPGEVGSGCGEMAPGCVVAVQEGH